jgi:UDP-N-acetylmuramoyl-L-alanyl-D-glutamate--2,6-diaminopimelate ligase
MQGLERWARKATGITCHSRQVLPGHIFVAICGRVVDGNSFAQSAADRGALAIVSDCPDKLPPLDIPVLAVPDARLALSALAAAFYQNPSWQLNLIGITGSNGKTTIACLLEHIFTQSGHPTGLIGTLRVSTGNHSIPSTLTTPDAVSLQHYLAQMVDNKLTHAVMEVSAQGIDMHRTAHVRFSTGILSNICADHLDFHGSFANYLEAKTRFLDLLADQTPFVVNITDPYCRKIAGRFTGRLVTAAIGNPADISVAINHLTPYGSSFTLALNKPLVTLSGQTLPPCQYAMNLAIPGRHNVENAMLAIAAALLHDLPPTLIAGGLETFRGVERRLDTFCLNGFTVVDDTALNPGSIEAVFSTIKPWSYRRLVVVAAIRGRRGTAINAENAASIAGCQRALPFTLIVTDSADQVGAADKVTPEERLAFLQTLATLHASYTYTPTLLSAVKAALRQVAVGDLLVLMGAQGMDAGRQVLTAITPAPALLPAQELYQPVPAL